MHVPPGGSCSARRWRIVLVSASLAAVRAAVGAGLGITVRTAEFIQSLGGLAHEIEQLPKLPQKQLAFTGAFR